ncbi:hypothetical protein K493DRAFT_317632 [Basidiobolus meristosporus CBS 931.73]|uniref:Proteasome assembly chaperone 2 n=1 Tax=Basidiobolus meristosporus CBS 931.73 TaxID=1314790 RepID=A0A1Y1XYX2_9FUNG|nr:hypothetical protein K493DRAFT_317632 [Basidiobolus meristosporus CBS 931.73]|eukprot:ORX90929.1 hypothetical protein K493DRAFT_317632 [Basidiobolus meristosporus CBS 931.73]
METTATFTLNNEQNVHLHPKVILGFPDNCIAGTRLLNSLQNSTDAKLNFDGYEAEEPLIADLDGEERIVVKNFDSLETSVIVINVLPSDKKLLALADALVNFISSSEIQTLYVLGAFDFTASKESLHIASLNTDAQLQYPTLNTAAPLNNLFLNTLITLLQLENISTQFLLYPSKKFKTGTKDDVQLLTYLSEQLTQIFGFTVIRERLDSLEMKSSEAGSSMMYL